MCIRDSPRYAMNKMLRWATKLSAFNYVIEHIPGEENVWADMLSRWGSHQSIGIRAYRIKIGSLVLAPVSPSLSAEYDWPKMVDIIAVQPDDMHSDKWSLENEVWKNDKGEIFIPETETNLQIRLLIAAHSGMSGHRAVDTTLSNLTRRFWWKTRDEDYEVSFHHFCTASLLLAVIKFREHWATRCTQRKLMKSYTLTTVGWALA